MEIFEQNAKAVEKARRLAERRRAQHSHKMTYRQLMARYPNGIDDDYTLDHLEDICTKDCLIRLAQEAEEEGLAASFLNSRGFYDEL